MRLAIDFADFSRLGRIPRHGWAKNSQGVKLLWLPVIRLVNQAHKIREGKGLPEALTRGQWSEIKAFDQTVRHFALTLQELAKCRRLGSDPCMDQNDSQKWTESYEASSLIPLYVDLAFVYARRLADHFARASRYVLFKNHPAAPREYKKLRPKILDQVKLRRLDPICDANILREAFENHSGWLDKLRDSEDEQKVTQKGIRDIMEHQPVATNFYHSQVGDGEWKIIADLGQLGLNASYRPDLIPVLESVVTDLARLWTMVCDSVGLSAVEKQWVAPYGDAVLLTDNSND